jgi:hypothetical protein
MTIRKDLLIAAGAALMLGLPAALQARADQPASPPSPASDQSMPAPAQAAEQPAAAAATTAAPAADTSTAAKDYPRCSKTVTDDCIQGGSHAKGHASKSAHHKKA